MESLGHGETSGNTPSKSTGTDILKAIIQDVAPDPEKLSFTEQATADGTLLCVRISGTKNRDLFDCSRTAKSLRVVTEALTQRFGSEIRLSFEIDAY